MIQLGLVYLLALMEPILTIVHWDVYRDALMLKEPLLIMAPMPVLEFALSSVLETKCLVFVFSNVIIRLSQTILLAYALLNAQDTLQHLLILWTTNVLLYALQIIMRMTKTGHAYKNALVYNYISKIQVLHAWASAITKITAMLTI